MRTLIVDHRHEPPRAPDGMAGVANAAVNKLSPAQLLIVVLVLALAAAVVGGHKLGLW